MFKLQRLRDAIRPADECSCKPKLHAFASVLVLSTSAVHAMPTETDLVSCPPSTPVGVATKAYGHSDLLKFDLIDKGASGEAVLRSIEAAAPWEAKGFFRKQSLIRPLIGLDTAARIGLFESLKKLPLKTNINDILFVKEFNSNIEKIELKNLSNEHVGSGENVGLIPDLKSGNPYVKDRNGCLKQVSASSWTHLDGRPVFNYLGFNEVVRIDIRPNAQSTKYTPHCSGFIIGSSGKFTYVVTAKHCVQPTKSSSSINTNLFLVNKLKENSSTIFENGSVSASFLIPPSDKDIAPTATESDSLPDIAMIKVEFATPNLRSAEPQSSSSSPSLALGNPSPRKEPYFLVIAGYGYGTQAITTSVDSPSFGALTVATWRGTASLPFIGNNFATLMHPENATNNSSAMLGKSCAGDSGSPVFSQFYSGSEPLKTRRLVIGIVANADTPDGIKDCLQSKKQTIQLFTPVLIKFICSIDRNINGCKNS